MNESKPLWQSRTLIAACVGILAVFLEIFWGLEVEEDMISAFTDQLVILVAFAATIWGRVAATRMLS